MKAGVCTTSNYTDRCELALDPPRPPSRARRPGPRQRHFRLTDGSSTAPATEVTDLTPGQGGLAFKAREIEEFVDVYFFRRCGIVCAHAARLAGLSPTAVTWLALVAGAVGGGALASPRYAWLGVALLVLHGILDSADGQLARMTGQSSEFGRFMDGVAGYVTHVAMYLGILASAFSRGLGWGLVAVAVVAGLSTIVHAQMYDYHRTTYTAIAIKGHPSLSATEQSSIGIVNVYESMQRALSGLHYTVERAIADRSPARQVSREDRDRYRECFYGPVRGWNLMGDNIRRLSIAIAVWAKRPEWFIYAELVPVNVAMAALWVRQRRADMRFLAAK